MVGSGRTSLFVVYFCLLYYQIMQQKTSQFFLRPWKYFILSTKIPIKLCSYLDYINYAKHGDGHPALG